MVHAFRFLLPGVLSVILFSLLMCSSQPAGHDSDSSCYRVISPQSSSTVTMFASFKIQWETIEGADVGEYVQIDLYKGDSRRYRIVDRTENDGSYRWDKADVVLPDSVYRILIADYDDPGRRYVYSQEFSAIRYDETYGVTYPMEGSIYNIGDVTSIRWTTSTVPGSTVVIDLYRDMVKVCRLEFESEVENDGFQGWAIPTYLESDEGYNLMVTSANDKVTSILSAQFAIVGLELDTFENDDKMDDPAVFDNYLYQERTLTVNDTDWAAVKLYENRNYVVQILGDSKTCLVAFTSDFSDTLFSLEPEDVGAMWTGYRNFTPDSTAVFLIMTRSVSRQVEDWGSYTLSVISSNDTGRLEVSVAYAAEVNEYKVSWDSSAIYGEYVSLDLYRDTLLLYQMNDSLTNHGYHKFTFGANIESASDYCIRVTALSAPAIFGLSDRFTVEGITADGYEEDGAQ